MPYFMISIGLYGLLEMGVIYLIWFNACAFLWMVSITDKTNLYSWARDKLVKAL